MVHRQKLPGCQVEILFRIGVEHPMVGNANGHQEPLGVQLELHESQPQEVENVMDGATE